MKQRNWKRLIAGDTVKPVDPGSMLNGEIITIQPGGKYTWPDGSGNDIASLSPDRIKNLKLTPETRARLRALDCDEAVQTWQAECSALDVQAEQPAADSFAVGDRVEVTGPMCGDVKPGFAQGEVHIVREITDAGNYRISCGYIYPASSLRRVQAEQPVERVVCSHCEGAGGPSDPRLWGSQRCEPCKGTGWEQTPAADSFAVGDRVDIIGGKYKGGWGIVMAVGNGHASVEDDNGDGRYTIKTKHLLRRVQAEQPAPAEPSIAERMETALHRRDFELMPDYTSRWQNAIRAVAAETGTNELMCGSAQYASGYNAGLLAAQNAALAVLEGRAALGNEVNHG